MLIFKTTFLSFAAMLAFTMVLSITHAPEASAGSMESARRLIDLLDLQAQLEETVIKSVDTAKDRLLKRGVPSKTVERVANALKAEMLESTPELMEEIAVTYADEFSEKELTDLITFYETPTGQKYVASQRSLKAKQTGAVSAWLQSVRERALARMQEAQV